MNRSTASLELIKQLVSALEAADLYLNSYDVSAPSRIKADTRLAVEDALGAAKASLAPAARPEAITASDAANAALASVDASSASRPLHFDGCHPGSGAYHQQFHAKLRQGICPGCFRPLTDGASGCRLYERHEVSR